MLMQPVSEGSISVPQALKTVEMPTSLRANDSLHKMVFRRSQAKAEEGIGVRQWGTKC